MFRHANSGWSERGHLGRAEHLNGAAVRLQLPCDVGHALGKQVVRRAVGQRAAEFDPLCEQHRTIDGNFVRQQAAIERE